MFLKKHLPIAHKNLAEKIKIIEDRLKEM